MNTADCLAIYEDAGFYDLEFAARDAEIPFFRESARRCGGPVLEVACGTGRITLPIAHDGHDMTGLDISRPMLDLARCKSEAAGMRIEWLEQDCREMRLHRTFALIFSATNAMQHLLDVDSACRFLQSARRTLRDDGTLILDVFNPNPAKLIRTADMRYMHKTIAMPDGTVIRVEAASSYDAARQVLHFDLFYLDGGKLLRTKRVDMRCFFPQELLALCKLNGLEIVRRLGDYDESDFASDSPKQILVCRRSSFP